MVKEAHKRLRQWIEPVIGDVALTFGPPAASSPHEAVIVYQTEIIPEPLSRNALGTRLGAVLRYLITSRGEDPETANQRLADLLVAANSHTEIELETEVPQAVYWQALGVPPQPCLLVRCRVWKEQPAKPHKLVQRFIPLMVASEPLQGIVTGPEDIPISGAEVEIPALNLSSKTDHHGRFNFASVPTGDSPRLLLVRAKGRERTFDIGKLKAMGKPIALQIDLEE